MIKFFRKIRQRLLSENKFSKYLLYAIGEVVLVVIGILIALNLNTNSENKKLVVQEIKILKEVKSELTVALEDVIDDLKDHECQFFLIICKQVSKVQKKQEKKKMDLNRF